MALPENRLLNANLKRDAFRHALAGCAATILFALLMRHAVGSAPASIPFAAAVYCLFLAYIARFLPHHGKESLGPANRITIIRTGLVATLLGLALQPADIHAHGWTVATLMIFTLALDGVDGWTARRFAVTSRFGGRFDQELDAFYTLILAFLLFRLDKTGAWVLLAGLWHYLFLTLTHFLPSFRAELPPAQRRKAICVINIGALILCVTPAIQPPLSQAIAGFAVLLLSASFLTDILWLANRRARQPSGTPVA